MLGQYNGQVIALVSYVLNVAAITCLLASLLTNSWLTTQERIPELQSDAVSPVLTATGIQMRHNITYNLRHTQSGMWTFCQQDPYQAEVDCFWIEHQIPDHNNMVDPRNATTCILYATMVSLPSLLSATSVTLLGIVTNFLMRFRKLYIFISGIIYILAGICTFTCVVIFITYVIQELEHKSQEKGEDGDHMFVYRYGYSLLLAMISFCCQELGGMALIYLAISRFTSHWKEKDRRLALQQHQLENASSAAHFTSFERQSSFEQYPPSSHTDGHGYGQCSDVRRYHSTSELDPRAFPPNNNTYPPPTQSHFTYSHQRLPSWYAPLHQHTRQMQGNSNSRSAENSPHMPRNVIGNARRQPSFYDTTNDQMVPLTNHHNDRMSSMANHTNHVAYTSHSSADRYRAAATFPSSTKQVTFFHTTAHSHLPRRANPLNLPNANSTRASLQRHKPLPSSNACCRSVQRTGESWKMTPV